MERSVGGPGIVFALVLAETAIGALAIVWLVPAWGRIKDGFFKLLGATIVVLAAAAWAAARAPLLRTSSAAPPAARAAVALLGAFAVATLLWQVLLWARARSASRLVGVAAIPIGVAALGALAFDPGARNAPVVSLVQLLAGAVFLGAVTDGLLLGHWHLVDRKASREPLARVNRFFLAGCGAVAVTVLFGGTGGGEARPDLSPLLGVGVLTVSIAVGLAALCALIAFFIRALIRENSLQSATGLFYLGVIMGIAAEFAAKVRFF